MSLHPDADAFVRAILADPAEVTTRLVFADWLEETGDPSNVAWAHFIRLNAEIANCPANSYERRKLERQRTQLEAQLRVTLTIPASMLIAHSGSLLQLLPSHCFNVAIAGFEIPRAIIEYLPESVARENLVLPLSLERNTLTIIIADSNNYDTVQKLQFILNKDIIAASAPEDEILAAINLHYGQTETESVDTVSYESPLIGLEGSENSSEIFGIFMTAFSEGMSGFQIERSDVGSRIGYLKATVVAREETLSAGTYEHLLNHLLSLKIRAQYTQDGCRCLDLDIPLLSGRRFPASVDRPLSIHGNRWFRVRFRWSDRE